MLDIKSLTIAELCAVFKELGEPRYRAKQVFKWLQRGINSFDDITDIPKDLRNRLKEIAYITNAHIERRFESKLDDTVKYLFKRCFFLV